jgi:hypothetical protein
MLLAENLGANDVENFRFNIGFFIGIVRVRGG